MRQVPPNPRSPVTINTLLQKKQQQQKISIVTCYDTPSAQIIADTSIDAVLVGDSVAMAIHGHPHTFSATLEMMVLHTQAVHRGLGAQFLMTDLPFLQHKKSLAETVQHVQTLIQAGAHAIKIEGADEDTCKTIHYLSEAGINIVGHIGLTAQSIHQLGGYRVQGKTAVQAERLMAQARALEKAGCCALVIECVPESLAQNITEACNIPTIGIGAGAYTDGQVLVWHDLLGLLKHFKPKFVKQYASLQPIIREALEQYVLEVETLSFPQTEHTYTQKIKTSTP
ncbi:MAG: 3-methyl-2-oxobutanoate hydroxymethyltransferase [Legionellaceae bacterium]|nr:3-methyl-2-oxobutanoate hydroxymethyltransferase [Legionellaceae bacterium]